MKKLEKELLTMKKYLKILAVTLSIAAVMSVTVLPATSTTKTTPTYKTMTNGEGG